MYYIFAVTIVPCIISFSVQYCILGLFKKKSFCIDDINSDKPQKFHKHNTPRAGGLGIFVAFLVSILFCKGINIKDPGILIASTIPVFLGGFLEDYGYKVAPKYRVIFIVLGSSIAIGSLHVIIKNIGFKLPQLFAMPLTIIAFVGVTNSINIIDGFHGLAAGVSLIALSSFIIISKIYHDSFILSLSSILLFSTLGFFVWNWPKGKIFLGDGGAYFLGFMLTMISILLVNRNPAISPWFPVCVLSYPVFEVLYSMYRRKVVKRKSPFEADKFHLHTLICQRISKENHLTAPYLWISVVLFNIMALLFHKNTIALMFLFLSFCSLYIYSYQSIIKFKTHKIPYLRGLKSLVNGNRRT